MNIIITTVSRASVTHNLRRVQSGSLEGLNLDRKGLQFTQLH